MIKKAEKPKKKKQLSKPFNHRAIFSNNKKVKNKKYELRI